MRILMMAQLFDPETGGSERQACRQAAYLAAAGDAVTVMARRSRGVGEAGIPGVREIRFGRADSPRPTESGGVLAALAFGLRSALHVLARGGDYDVLYLHGAGLISALIVPAARLRGLRTVAKVSGGRSGSEAGSLRGRGPGQGLALRIFRGVDAWIAVSREIEEGLKQDGFLPERIHRIPNGVDLERFRPLPPEERRRVRRELGWPEDGLVAVFAGRLIESKGLVPFARAWRGPALLAILGEGPERSELEGHPSVRLMGSRTDVERVMGAADLLVFPSRREGMPNAVLEAMASGLPVAAYRIGGVTDLVTDGVEGVLVTEGDDAALAQAGSRLLADPAALVRMGEAARRRASGFDARDLSRRLRALFYGSLTSNPPSMV